MNVQWRIAPKNNQYIWVAKTAAQMFKTGSPRKEAYHPAPSLVLNAKLPVLHLNHSKDYPDPLQGFDFPPLPVSLKPQFPAGVSFCQLMQLLNSMDG